MTEQALQNLAKARIRAQERKTELKELNSKSKALKEEQLRQQAEEYDKIKLKRNKKKKLN